MIYLNCDYTEGAHPAILERLMQTNMEQTIGYGMDEYCKSAAECVKKACKCENAAVHFLVGGTQANVTVLDAALKPYQGVLCAESGHINVHETGAIEACGHKCLTLPSSDGKITANQVEAYAAVHFANGGDEHMVQPKMVYISNPTELGTIYKEAELKALYEVCRKYGMYLFMDGARLGYGLTCKENDLTLESIAKLTDVFYIGGTKVGALFGEAVVITNPELQQDFRYNIKQHGGMLAKGRLLGIQFETLLTDNRYFDIARKGNELAEQIRKCFEELNVEFVVDSPTNQIFVVLPNEVLNKISKKFYLENQGAKDEQNTVVRVCTSWATKEENVALFIEEIREAFS